MQVKVQAETRNDSADVHDARRITHKLIEKDTMARHQRASLTCVTYVQSITKRQHPTRVSAWSKEQ
jgi:hypothetical protein